MNANRDPSCQHERNRRKYRIAIIVKLVPVLFLSALCSQNAIAVNSKRPVAEPVSIQELITNPRKFSGKVISVTGYTLRVLTRDALFFTREHSMMLDRGNVVYLEGMPDSVMNPLKKSCERKHASVHGVFKKSKYVKGWVISDITEIYEYHLKAQRTAKPIVCWSRP